MRRYVMAMLGASLVLSAGLSGPVSAQEGTSVTDITPTVAGSQVSVTGAASFVDVPRQVGNDPAGDATISGIGADITTMTVARPNPFAGSLQFTFGVADAPPAALVAGPTVLYTWPVTVNDNDTGLYLEGRSVSAFQPTGANPAFVLMRDSADGFANVATLSGTMDGSIVRWNVSTAQLGAGPGDRIGQGAAGGGLGTTTAVPGLLRFNGNLGGDAGFVDNDYVVPAPEVRIGIAPAGTDPEAVALTQTAAVASPGNYSGSLAKPVEAGNYVVVARACYGAGNCGLAAATITVE